MIRAANSFIGAHLPEAHEARTGPNCLTPYNDSPMPPSAKSFGDKAFRGTSVPRVLSESDIADFRERLCQMATQLFVERGPENFNMRLLASKLGVSAMTPY